MKLLTFLFFADTVHHSTADRAIRALVLLKHDTPQPARPRRVDISAQAAQDLRSSLDAASKESAVLRALLLAMDLTAVKLLKRERQVGQGRPHQHDVRFPGVLGSWEGSLETFG
ncbi:hypothetical protein B0T20DRAFT_477564 [Sordaria brevicollis]|uniref:Uncharacterized protein n=1 Tax=Sordaria brevicollis TaxID=83679 RepID=A0AAE0PH82_SORBR|nr:hypothetical protein B0T20DRAFT_477564 [Sordaria brevicollis]